MPPSGKTQETEVLIIGAGAAGGILAVELARRRIRIVVIDSGPKHEIAKRGEYAKLYLRGENPWKTPLEGLDEHTTLGDPGYRLEWQRARGVGGSTLHWEGYTLRLGEEDFRLKSLYGVGRDWPVSYAEMEPYYSAAETALGVAGQARFSPPQRSEQYPLPAFDLSYSDRFFEAGCKSLGIPLRHIPQARNSIPYGGRPQCTSCGTCRVCPTGAKASVDLTHIPIAEATGYTQVWTDVMVLRLEADRSGKVRAAIYAGQDRVERRIKADIFVVAAGAVETPRLLLLSACGDFPRGLANGSGLVGKGFMSHPVVDVTARMPDKVYPYRVGFSTAMADGFAAGRDRSKSGAFLLQMLNDAGPTPGQIAASCRKWGSPLREHVLREFGHTLGIRVFCEQLPDEGNNVSLDDAKADFFGNTVPRITYNIGPYERTALAEGKRVAAAILEVSGASAVQTSRMFTAAHQIGTHRMGDDPERSVVDPNLRCHDVPNLFLIGSGCFPTSSPFPPTLTIAALAIRAGRHIASMAGRGT